MDLLHAIILALVQGITEFLPISSSAHLILLPRLLDWSDQGLAYDIAAHLGTLGAVVIYFRQDLWRLLQGGQRSIMGRGLDADGRLFWMLVVGTVPVALCGFLLYDMVAHVFRDPLIIAGTNLVFAALLWFADATAVRLRPLERAGWRDAIVVGLAQMLALVPGTSRSGVTMTAGLLLGLTRQAAARFSFLLAVPVLLLSGGYELYRIFTLEAEADMAAFILVALLSFITAFAVIHLFLRFLDRTGMLPYVIYRLLLGVVLIVLFI